MNDFVDSRITTVKIADLLIKDFYNNRSYSEIDTKQIVTISADGMKTVWKMRFKVLDEYYGCYLILDDIVNSTAKELQVYLKFSIVNPQNKDFNVKEDTFKFEKKAVHGFDSFISKDYLNVMGAHVLIDGVLLIRCEFKLVDFSGDIQQFCTDYEKLQMEYAKRMKKYETLELDYDRVKKELLLKKVELKQAEEKIEQLQQTVVEPLKEEYSEIEHKFVETKIHLEEEVDELKLKITEMFKDLGVRDEKIEQHNNDYEALIRERDELKIQLELIRAMAEDVVVNQIQPNQTTSVEDLREDWEKLDYDYY